MTPRQEAKAQGLTHYLPAKPCKRGHLSERFVSSGNCCQCIVERQQTPEALAQKAAYDAKRHQTPEYKAQQAEYYTANTKQIAAYHAEYNKLNAEKIAAYQTAWYQANRERVAAQSAAYTKANRHAYNAHGAARRAAKLQATPLWVDFEAIKAIYRLCAEKTKATGTKHAVDHIYPLVSDEVCGLHVAANLQILTKSENSRKHNRMPAPEQVPSDLE